MFTSCTSLLHFHRSLLTFLTLSSLFLPSPQSFLTLLAPSSHFSPSPLSLILLTSLFHSPYILLTQILTPLTISSLSPDTPHSLLTLLALSCYYSLSLHTLHALLTLNTPFTLSHSPRQLWLLCVFLSILSLCSADRVLPYFSKCDFSNK